MLGEHWLAELGPDAIAILVFLVIAADRRGVSYYARDRMTVALGLDLGRVNEALERLLAAAWWPTGPGGVVVAMVPGRSFRCRGSPLHGLQ